MNSRRAAHHLLGLLILLAFLWMGNTPAWALRLPLPVSVAGMLMLAGALRLRSFPEPAVLWRTAASAACIRRCT